MQFAINPPNTPMVDDRGFIRPEWYRYLVQQRKQGDNITDSDVLTLGPAQDIYPNSRELAVTANQLTRTLTDEAVTLGLADTTVVATSYGSESKTVSFTVDAKGRLTDAEEFDLNTDNVTEGSTNFFFTDTRARLAISGTVGNIAYDNTTGVIDLEEVPGVAGTYASPTSITVDDYGRITAIS